MNLSLRYLIMGKRWHRHRSYYGGYYSQCNVIRLRDVLVLTVAGGLNSLAFWRTAGTCDKRGFREKDVGFGSYLSTGIDGAQKARKMPATLYYLSTQAMDFRTTLRHLSIYTGKFAQKHFNPQLGSGFFLAVKLDLCIQKPNSIVRSES